MPTDLRQVTLFQGLPDNEINAIQRQLREVKHPAGSDLTVRGEGGVGFMVLLDGEAEAQLASGRTRKLARGDHFGEMALLDHDARSASVKALTDVTVAVIPEWSFKAFLRDHPEVSYRLLETLSRRLREAES